MKKKLIIQFFLVVISAWAASDAHAHRVTIFAWVDGDTVHTQSKFSGGKKVNNGEINVYNAEGKLLLKGKTDKNGEFSFKVPEKTSLRIELIAGMGHKNEWIVPIEELGMTEKKEGGREAAGLPDEKPGDSREKQSEFSITAGITREEFEQAVEQAVEKKLKPVMQMLSQLSDPRPGISEILGGIGYIIGLFGIWAYVKSREKTSSGRQ